MDHVNLYAQTVKPLKNTKDPVMEVLALGDAYLAGIFSKITDLTECQHFS